MLISTNGCWKESGSLICAKASEFQGHGTLREKALQLLVPVWQEGTAEQVAAAMDDFREKYQAELLKARPAVSENGSRS
jgi:hypothetical protein